MRYFRLMANPSALPMTGHVRREHDRTGRSTHRGSATRCRWTISRLPRFFRHWPGAPRRGGRARPANFAVPGPSSSACSRRRTAFVLAGAADHRHQRLSLDQPGARLCGRRPFPRDGGPALATGCATRISSRGSAATSLPCCWRRLRLASAMAAARHAARTERTLPAQRRPHAVSRTSACRSALRTAATCARCCMPGAWRCAAPRMRLDVVVPSRSARAWARRHCRAAAAAQRGMVSGREVRDGLLRGEFKVHYQPIHNFGTGRVDTLEALVRWRHPTRACCRRAASCGAERAGLTHVISVRVLDCACDACAAGARAATAAESRRQPVAQDFRRDDFAGTVASTLERHALPPSSLELELTEHEQLDDDARCLRQPSWPGTASR